MPQIFLSHTRLDKDFCDYFDSIYARVGIKAFRSEFEAITPPAWLTIRNEIRISRALFLLVGGELTRKQSSHGIEWEYTQNWIAYEIGVASERNIPVWVCVDEGIAINFPVPFLTDYIIGEREANRLYLREVLTSYNKGSRFQLGEDYWLTCPYDNCGLGFWFHTPLPPGSVITCPQCLQGIQFEHGWVWDEQEIL